MTRRHYKGKFTLSEKPNICANCKKEWYIITYPDGTKICNLCGYIIKIGDKANE